MFLLDKYKLKSIDDVVFHKDIYQLLQLDKSSDYDNLPHLLLYGRHGSGKKSIINLLLSTIYDDSELKTKKVTYTITGYGNTNVKVDIEQSNYHIIIEPKNSGFDKYLIQEIVKEYARLQVLNVFKHKKTFKVVLINNVDNLSYYAQTSLRCTMEKYVRTCKFILCGYQISKVIEPLRSRCLPIRVPSPTDDEIFRTIYNIAKKEDISLSLEHYNEIIEKADNNIKEAIWLLEFARYGVPFDTSWKIMIIRVVNNIIRCSKKKINGKCIEEIREVLYTIFITNTNGTRIIRELLKQLLERVKDDDIRFKIINMAAKYEHRLAVGKRCILHLEAFIYNVIEELAKTKIKVKVYDGEWDEDDTNESPNLLFVYGDNDESIGKKGQAVIRDAKNAIGIPTKKEPTLKKKAFYTDDELMENKIKIVTAIQRLKKKMMDEGYEGIVFSSAGLGTGLARLNRKAPETFQFLQNEIRRLVESYEEGSSGGMPFLN